MIPRTELAAIARARLQDAKILYREKRYDGAKYLCGYAVEIALKARICRTLQWSGYPETRKEFEPYQSFKTHNLETLLRLSGVEARIKIRYFAEWSAVASWNPEVRYKPTGTATATEAKLMLDSATILLRTLL